MLKQLALAGVFVLVAGTLNAQSTATATPAPDDSCRGDDVQQQEA